MVPSHFLNNSQLSGPGCRSDSTIIRDEIIKYWGWSWWPQWKNVSWTSCYSWWQDDCYLNYCWKRWFRALSSCVWPGELAFWIPSDTLSIWSWCDTENDWLISSLTWKSDHNVCKQTLQSHWLTLPHSMMTDLFLFVLQEFLYLSWLYARSCGKLTKFAF